MKHPRTISIRCIIAIVLMALTIVFLFWPSFFSIKAKNTLSGASAGYSQSFLEYRNDITQMLQDAKQKQAILDRIDTMILPRMEKLAESPRDFHVQLTRALAMLQRGGDEETVKKARNALELAWFSRPEVEVGRMVLDLDRRLNDGENAERHALQILRLDENHPFANWIMGSIRMKKGEMPEAERYLRTSVVAAHPLAEAQNDLAELLRKDGRLEEAEKFARAATKTDPKLYVAWETLASTLLDRGKNLGEAEQCIQKAIELFKDKDPRLLLTKVRVQIAKNDFPGARKTLRDLGKRRNELSEGDGAVFENLQKQLQGK